MKIATLWHNPGAGDEAFTEEELTALIESNGFDCHCVDEQDATVNSKVSQSDFVIVAGGDGTVRGVIKDLLSKTDQSLSVPIALLPSGTANNIATTLNISGTIDELVDSWHTAHAKDYDVGFALITGQKRFFLESFGIGLFPNLMREMKTKDEDELETAEEKLDLALHVLLDSIENYAGKPCRILLDGTEYVGQYVLVEVMNTRMIGPNLELAPAADPGDGVFEVVLVRDDQRSAFKTFVQQKINGSDLPFDGNILKASSIELQWDGLDAHIDDELLDDNAQDGVEIELKKGHLRFLVPKITK